MSASSRTRHQKQRGNDSETLFNGAISAASVDHVQNSHACPPRRYHAAVDWTARAALHAPQ
jgi:hypothetical protein